MMIMSYTLDPKIAMRIKVTDQGVLILKLFNSRRHHSKAVQTGNKLLRSPSVQGVHVDENLFHFA